MKDIKKIIADIHKYSSTNTITISIVVFLFLLVGLVVTVDQATRQQDTRSQAATPIKNCTIANNQITLDTEEKKILQLINQYRKEKQLPALQQNATLNRSAAWMANDMATKNYFNHRDSAKRLYGKRVVDCGYRGKENQVRENIVAGKALNNAQAVFNEWKNSKTHNETMLDKTMVSIGVGKKNNPKAKLGWYWVMDVTQTPETDKNQPPDDTDGTNPPSDPDDDCDLENLSVETESSGANFGGFPGGSEKNTTQKKNEKNNKNDKKNNKKNPKKKNAKKNNTKKSGNQNQNPQPTPDCDEEPDEENEEENEEEETIPTPRPQIPGVFFDVSVPGIGGDGNADPVHPTRNLSIQMLNATGSASFNKTIEAEFDGNVFYAFIDGKEIPAGNYQIRVKLPNSLRKILIPEYQTIDTKKQTTIKVSDLVMGDFDNNNILNIADFNIFRACVDSGFLNDDEELIEEDEFIDDEEEEFLDEEDEDIDSESLNTRIQAAACSQHSVTDINDDGVVDMIDYNFLLESFATLRGN